MVSRTLWWLALLVVSRADIYMHNPRGSNDRNCERNVNRNNGNRLFDSQNNAAGGYACPRAVGDDEIQNEAGDTLEFTGGFRQNKRMYYYEGSILPIEWTNQHGCGGNSKVSCEIILQYACEDTLDPQVDNFWPFVSGKNNEEAVGRQHFRFNSHIAAPRDGVPRDSDDAATDTIPDNEANAIPSNRENRRYGMHESYDFYQLCQRTQRNKGLYTADQQMRRNDQRGTRQNPNGNRNGFECPEERDYYPWWHPSPWIDVAVLTDSALGNTPCKNPSDGCSYRCAYYLENSMNKGKKGYCDVNHATETVDKKLNNNMWKQNQWYNQKASCEAAGFTWYEVSHSDNLQLDYPVCGKTQFSRTNHLGNAINTNVLSGSVYDGDLAEIHNAVAHGVNANRFIWQIPKIPELASGVTKGDYFNGFDNNGMEDAYKSCVLRIRYNMSSADFPAWPADALDPATAAQNVMVDHRNNTNLQLGVQPPLFQDPYVYIGPGDSEQKGSAFVSLAVNTNQYSRTFQDRSYVFSIKKLPSSNKPANDNTDQPKVDVTAINNALNNNRHIYNVNVRGKRGNIVQTFPSVEYDFVPNMLKLQPGDMIHFQWTGSDYNPRRGCNDAEGGPPDLNTYFTSANANFNSRADRNNLIFTESMGHNTPMDMLGYDPADNSLTFNAKRSLAQTTTLEAVPCTGSTEAENDDCYASVMRLAYLNQQSDGGSLALRQQRDCLTEDELDEIADKNTRENHPLNCAKMNAKPYPYFDGGIMFMRKKGYFPFFSSRNNNFSNRQQIGIICVGNDAECPIDDATGVVQSANPATQSTPKRTSVSRCNDEASAEGIGNNNGASSCITGDANILTGETFATPQADNDALGDGDKNPCEVMRWNVFGDSTSTVEEQVALAIGLLFAGIGATWLGYYLYNRHRATQDKNQVSRFKNQKAWKKATETEMI